METAPPELVAQLREMADPDGWLPPWPRWWGEEALAELLPDPVIRERFTAGCPALPLAMFTRRTRRRRAGPTRRARTCG